jgi:hypothetical protein
LGPFDGKSLSRWQERCASRRGAAKASISTFVQFGLNNSETLPVKEYFGLGFTGFGLVPHRLTILWVSAWLGRG